MHYVLIIQYGGYDLRFTYISSDYIVSTILYNIIDVFIFLNYSHHAVNVF